MFQVAKRFAQGITLTAALAGAAASQEPKPAPTEPPPTSATTQPSKNDIDNWVKSFSDRLKTSEAPKPPQEIGAAIKDKSEAKVEPPTLEVLLQKLKEASKPLTSPQEFEAAHANILLTMNQLLECFSGFRSTLGLCSDTERAERWTKMSDSLAPTVAFFASYEDHIHTNLQVYLFPRTGQLTQEQTASRKAFTTAFFAEIERKFDAILEEYRFSPIEKTKISAFLKVAAESSQGVSNKLPTLQAKLGINPRTGGSGEREYFDRITKEREEFLKQQAAASSPNPLTGQTTIAKPQDTETNSTAQNIAFLTQAVALGATVWGAYKLVRR